ncbi:Pyruvate, phosphate dikinase, partial [Aduncisulcus paluster]
DRLEALSELQPIQKGDFIGIFEAMGSRPVTIRLLDPPLHEFLPHEKEDIVELAEAMHMPVDRLEEIVHTLSEFNPMLGHRGCRLAITYPEIYAMQCRAIFEAIVHVAKEEKIDVHPEIMIPLVGHDKELLILADMVKEIGNDILKEAGIDVPYKVGTMIEVPRAALTADEIAEHADFFSFGTNDLTQMTLGFSRDDAGKFIGEYKQKDIFQKDPFESIDQVGVGKLMKIAVDLGRQKKPGLKIG